MPFMRPVGMTNISKNALEMACLRISKIYALEIARLRNYITTRYSSPLIRSLAGPKGGMRVKEHSKR